MIPIKSTLLALLLALPGLALAQTPDPGPPVPPPPAPSITLSGPATLLDHSLGQYAVTGGAGIKVAWLVMPNTSQAVLDQQLVMTGAPGTYTVIALAVQAGQPVILQQSVTIQGTVPPGPGPGPGPGPTPDPGPGPGPTPSPAPIPDQGLRVLILYESSKLSTYPPAQLGALYDQGLRTYLNSVVIRDPATGVSEYRVWDKDIRLTGESDLWSKAMARPHPTMPWVLISNGDAGYEGPLPGTAAEIQALIKRFVK